MGAGFRGRSEKYPKVVTSTCTTGLFFTRLDCLKWQVVNDRGLLSKCPVHEGGSHWVVFAEIARYQPKGQLPTSTGFRKLQVALPHGHLEKPSSVNWASDSRGMSWFTKPSKRGEWDYNGFMCFITHDPVIPFPLFNTLETMV